MQLSYRGAEYIPCTELPATSQSFYGTYRGAEMTIRHSSELPVQPPSSATPRRSRSENSLQNPSVGLSSNALPTSLNLAALRAIASK
jgi:hypothetical protein